VQRLNERVLEQCRTADRQRAAALAEAEAAVARYQALEETLSAKVGRSAHAPMRPISPTCLPLVCLCASAYLADHVGGGRGLGRWQCVAVVNAKKRKIRTLTAAIQDQGAYRGHVDSPPTLFGGPTARRGRPVGVVQIGDAVYAVQAQATSLDAPRGRGAAAVGAEADSDAEDGPPVPAAAGRKRPAPQAPPPAPAPLPVPSRASAPTPAYAPTPAAQPATVAQALLGAEDEPAPLIRRRRLRAGDTGTASVLGPPPPPAAAAAAAAAGGAGPGLGERAGSDAAAHKRRGDGLSITDLVQAL
jgi:hypothetical protein